MRRRDFVLLLGGGTARPPRTAEVDAVIGFLGSTSPGPYSAHVAAFHQGLGEAGYVEGQNVTIEYRWAEGNYDRLAALAADLVARNVDIIAAGSAPSARAAKNATSTIPIVFTSGGDPVAAGLVDSLARPGGNATGASILNAGLLPKRLELLSDLVPQAKMIAVLVNPNNWTAGPMISEAEEAARTKGVELQILRASTESEIEAAFQFLAPQRIVALVVGTDAFFLNARELLVTLATRHSVPAIYEWREFVVAGGLISYGASVTAPYRLAGGYVGRILKGAKPADLPVQQPTTFELVINLKTAKALRLTVPPSILARAEEVIE